jgi:hypothetical protein
MTRRFYIFVLFIFAVSVPIGIVVGQTIAPPETSVSADKCDHTSSSRARFAAVRILPPVQVESFDGRTLRVADKFASETFDVDGTSIVNLPKDLQGKWFWVMYCEKDRHLYVITELSPDQQKR